MPPQTHTFATGPSTRNIVVTESIYTPAQTKVQESNFYRQEERLVSNANNPEKQSALAQMGRKAYSIRPEPQGLTYNNISSNNQYAFDSYDQVLKNIDKQLTESRRMFP